MSRDLSFPSTPSSASQEGHESRSGQAPNKKLKVTLLSSEWGSTKGGLSTINRMLAIQLAKHSNVEVSMYLSECSEEDVRNAEEYHVKLVQARKSIGSEPIEWLSCAPENHEIDYVIGHGVILGQQVQHIQRNKKCKWVQVVHTAPEDLGMFKGYANAISRAEEKHKAEIELCESADEVVAVGPKLADAYSSYLRYCQRDRPVFELTPGIFSEFSDVKQAATEGSTFRVLVFGRGDTEDFELKGYDIAAKAISELNETSYHLIFVGASPGKEEEVAKKLRQHDIERRQLAVRSFKGRREELRNLFFEVDLCIMPSRTEGFGLAALEALSAGLPILVSENSGLGDALRKVPHGSSCVVNSEDPKEWAKAIKIVRKKSRSVRLQEAEDLRTQYAKTYCWKEQCDKLVERMSDSIFGTNHASESGQGSSLTRSHLPSTVVSEAYVEPTRAGINYTEKQGKRPLHPSVTPPSMRQSHDTDVGRGTNHAREGGQGSSLTRSHLPSTEVSEACEEPTRAGINCRAAIADSVKLLKRMYQRRANWLRPLEDIPLRLDEVYTRLKIVSGPKRSPSAGSEIDLGDIFGCKGENSMALVEGSPGIGKSTFCLKLAYDWTNESMPSTFPLFELVLLLKCRDVNGDIKEAIFEQLLPEDLEVKTKKRLQDFITDVHSQERILVILDGLDETPEKSVHHVDKLLERKILPVGYVLATTRQEKGIEARKKFAFDICLEIKGFTEADSCEYIRKHFKNDPYKGESLIKETRENTFLRALQNNPLNLLLLCVVYEDHKGKLPSSRTNLYQIIVRCLLRRYCERHSVEACEEDGDLENRFEANILVLGELAWEGLLNDRLGFQENELTVFERSDDKLVARCLGLVYKEESLKKLKRQHEYFFLHRTFQEYLAASYITHKLRRGHLNVFDRVDFEQVVKKFPQVFLFVCGILQEEASILFKQIGNRLVSYWDWYKCTDEAANFFVKCFSESGNPEHMADTLFSLIPFPRVLHFCEYNGNLSDVEENWMEVLCACTGFSKVQGLPAEVHVAVMLSPYKVHFRNFKSLPNVKSVNLSGHMDYFNGRKVFEAISYFTSLSELTLPIVADWETAAKYLTTNKTLQKVTFVLLDKSDDGWAKALDAGLCADTPLSSVGVRIHGSLSPTALQALRNLLFHKSLSSLFICICGDMQDSLAEALARGLTGQIAVKVVDLCVNGKLSLNGANLIERSIVENNFRSKLNVCLRGEVPDNWPAVGRNIHSRLREETSASFALWPNSFGVTASSVTQFCPVEIKNELLVEQNVTLNVWGELGADGAEGLFEGLLRNPLSHLTLNIHGNLTGNILFFTARLADELKALSSLTVNTWEELTKEGKILSKELKLDNNPAVTFIVRDVPAPPNESRDPSGSREFVAIDDFGSLLLLFEEAKNTGKQNLSATIRLGWNLIRNTNQAFLDDVLACNTTLNALSLRLRDDGSSDSGVSVSLHCLIRALARSRSLKNLTLTICDSLVSNDAWRKGESHSDVLERNTSLKNLSLIIEGHVLLFDVDYTRINFPHCESVENIFLTVNSYVELSSFWIETVCDELVKSAKSLKNLTLTINNFRKLTWESSVNHGLKNKSLNAVSLTINDYGKMLGDGSHFAKFLFRLRSLTTFDVTLNLWGKGDKGILHSLLAEAVKSGSLETLRLNVNDPETTNGRRGYDFSEFTVMSPSLSLIELTVSFYGVEESSRE